MDTQGGLVGFWINYGLTAHMKSSHTQWLIPFAIQLVPGGMLFLGCLWIKESPRWLYGRGRRDQALRNLCWIRQLSADDLYIVEEVNDIDMQLEQIAAGYGSGLWCKPTPTSQAPSKGTSKLTHARSALQGPARAPHPLALLPRYHALRRAECQRHQRVRAPYLEPCLESS